MEHFLLQLYTTLLEFSLPVKTIGFSFFLKILPDRSLHHCFHIAFNWITVEKKKKKQPYPYIELHMVHTPINCDNHGVHRTSDQRHSTSYFFSSWEHSSNSYIYAHKTVPLRYRILCLKLCCMMTSHRQIDKLCWKPRRKSSMKVIFLPFSIWSQELDFCFQYTLFKLNQRNKCCTNLKLRN